MAYFECIVGNGGGGQTDIPLIVNCDAQFAGLTITATQGQLSYTETCPSTSPYQVVFHLPQDGTWTISGTIEGTPYSESITISAFELDLKAGFDYEAWLTAGGLDPTGYADLAAVFADEAATRQLMLVHASADYLAGKVSDDVTVLDDFAANDTAMKWLGLSDYLVDKLIAITGAEAKLLGSTYWERYLKDHVPTMTSNTAPYGTANTSSTAGTDYAAWKAFDKKTPDRWLTSTSDTTKRLYYQFTNPIAVQAFRILYLGKYVKDYEIQASNDGTNWTTKFSGTRPDAATSIDNPEDSGVITFTNSDYYLYWCIQVTTQYDSIKQAAITELQFYGRSLDVSVPTMTSSVLPYGEVISTDTASSSHPNWYAFDGSDSTYWSTNGQNMSQIGYKFASPVKIKRIRAMNANSADITWQVRYSDDGITWVDVTGATITTSASAFKNIDINVAEPHQYWAIGSITSGTTASMSTLNFYGVSYSEKEFETGTTKKWIYDHGVEVMPLGTAITQGSSSVGTKNADYLYEKISAASTAVAFMPTDSIDFNNYSIMRIRLGDIYYTSSSYAILGIGAKTARSYSSSDHSLLAEATFKTGVNPSALGLDISSITNTAYAVAGIYATSNQTYEASIKEWWLE